MSFQPLIYNLIKPFNQAYYIMNHAQENQQSFFNVVPRVPGFPEQLGCRVQSTESQPQESSSDGNYSVERISTIFRPNFTAYVLQGGSGPQDSFPQQINDSGRPQVCTAAGHSPSSSLAFVYTGIGARAQSAAGCLPMVIEVFKMEKLAKRQN